MNRDLFDVYINGIAAAHRIRQCGKEWATDEMRSLFPDMTREEILVGVVKRYKEIYKDKV